MLRLYRGLGLGLRRDRGSGLSTIFVIGLVFLLVGIMVLLLENFKQYNEQVRSSLMFEIYLKDDTTPAELYRLSLRVSELPGVASLRYQDKSAALQEMQELLGSELLPVDEPNPFPNSLVVGFLPDAAQLESFDVAATQLGSLRCVAEIGYDRDWLEQQEPILGFIELLSSVLALLVFAAAVILIFWAVNRNAQIRRAEVKVLQLLGAGWRQIGIPFMAEGALIGLLGAITGLLVLYLLWRLSGRLPLQLDYVSTTAMVAVPLSGLLAGMTAGYFVVRRLVK